MGGCSYVCKVHSHLYKQLNQTEIPKACLPTAGSSGTEIAMVLCKTQEPPVKDHAVEIPCFFVPFLDEMNLLPRSNPLFITPLLVFMVVFKEGSHCTFL